MIIQTECISKYRQLNLSLIHFHKQINMKVKVKTTLQIFLSIIRDPTTFYAIQGNIYWLSMIVTGMKQ